MSTIVEVGLQCSSELFYEVDHMFLYISAYTEAFRLSMSAVGGMTNVWFRMDLTQFLNIVPH